MEQRLRQQQQPTVDNECGVSPGQIVVKREAEPPGGQQGISTVAVVSLITRWRRVLHEAEQVEDKPANHQKGKGGMKGVPADMVHYWSGPV